MPQDWDTRELTASGRSHQPRGGFAPSSARRAATPSAAAIVVAFLRRLILDKP